jgi:DNA-nicking Smr family endonuclease
MAPRSKSNKFRQHPFSELDQMLSRKAIHLDEGSRWVHRARQQPAPVPPEEEAELFKAAMKGVLPLRANYHAGPRASPMRLAVSPLNVSDEDDDEGLRQLRDLVEHGKGFILQYTDEYMSGPDESGTDPLTHALHQGKYTIQDHIDLHGLRVSEAETALEAFFKRAVANGKQGLLIVHGRGLRSVAAPVLKRRVSHWLTRGPWRRWVAAFASAQAYDGGTGATYVLLRKSPMKKHRP